MTLLTVPNTPTPTELLTETIDGPVTAGRHLWGFGGVHGGLALAMAVGAMARVHPTDELRSVTGQFLRPLRGGLQVRTHPVRLGRSTQVVRAEIAGDDRLSVSAVATFGAGRGDAEATSPEAPDAGVPTDHATFAPPPEFVPISVFTEIRPVGDNLPFLGSPEPELVAWIRLVGDDTPVDAGRLILLADALAPSYAAVLTDLVMIPTLELTVRLTAAVRQTCSPWVLLWARSDSVTADGWVHESLDLWGPDGAHLARAEQLRVLGGSASSP